VPTADAEVARAWLLERFSAGFEERERDKATELAVYTDAAGESAIRGAFAEVDARPVEGGWEDRWKEFHRPVWAGGLWIGPPWIVPPPEAETVVVDPGRAFGTGAHATTRACIEVLAGLERGSLLDAGCGSGVVAVAAARLGFAPVRAVDVDEAAAGVAAETARRNEVAVDVSHADVLADDLPMAEVVVANIELTVVDRLLQRLTARVVVTSGYLDSEAPAAPGWTHIDRLALEGWAADVFAAQH
jgi:ribosomal protein L11 methyltransferase